LRTPASVRVALALAAAVLLPAEIVDRVAVAVGNRVITTTDIERDIRVTAFLNGVKPDLGPKEKRAAADRLTDQLLIRVEFENSGYAMPDPKEAEPMLESLKKGRFPTAADYQAALNEYGITEQQIKDALLWQRAFLLFVDERFRPAIQVDEKEIAEYFAKEVAPKAREARPGKEPTIDEFRTQIEDAIAGKRVDEELSNWLAAKRRTRILIFPEAFQ
jgi:hypothetical protein